MRYEGELAALLAAMCWTVSTLAFASAGRRVGSIAVNIIRMVAALLLLTLACLWVDGRLVALELPGRVWLWMSLSGVIGFFLGDLALFRAFVLIGPRLSSLLMSLAPPFAAVFAFLWLGEVLSLWQLFGMALTLAGVGWVILENQPDDHRAAAHEHRSIWGVVLGVLGAMGQGLGLVMAKVAMVSHAMDEADDEAGEMPAAGGLPPMEGLAGPDILPLDDGPGLGHALVWTQIRAMSATLLFLLLLLSARQRSKVVAAMRHPAGLGLITLGAIVGPFLGVALLLRSTELIPAGVAQTLVATVPVMILPCLVVLYRQRISLRSVIGAVIAVTGVSILVLGKAP